jgi:hypothetical protein
MLHAFQLVVDVELRSHHNEAENSDECYCVLKQEGIDGTHNPSTGMK